jgi:prephenate dehydrogenase
MRSNSLIIGGSGAVGTLLSKLLRDRGFAVSVADICAEDASLRFDLMKTEDRQRLLAVAVEFDVVVSCLPLQLSMEVLPSLGAIMNAESLLVDTCSVKMGLIPLVCENARCQYVSINPLFGHGIDIYCQDIAVVERIHGARAVEFLSILRDSGARVILMTLESHDELVSLIQATLHATILCLAEMFMDGNQSIAPGATPISRKVIHIARRIGGNTSHVLNEIQFSNTLAESARCKLASQIASVGHGQPNDYVARWKKVLGWINTLDPVHFAGSEWPK